MQIRHWTPDRKQEGNYQIRAMNKNCVAVARLRLHVVYVSPPPSRNSQGQQWDSHSGVRVPVLHNRQQQNAALSAGCQLRRTGRLLTEFNGTSVRHLTHCTNPSLAYNHNVYSFASCATLFFVKFCKRLITVVFCVRVLIIKQKTAYSDRKYEEVK